MTTKENLQKMYEGKFFYKVKPVDEKTTVLFGPFDDIYHLSPAGQEQNPEYAFMQVIDGIPVQAFKSEEILVTDRKL